MIKVRCQNDFGKCIISIGILMLMIGVAMIIHAIVWILPDSPDVGATLVFVGINIGLIGIGLIGAGVIIATQRGSL